MLYMLGLSTSAHVRIFLIGFALMMPVDLSLGSSASKANLVTTPEVVGPNNCKVRDRTDFDQPCEEPLGLPLDIVKRRLGKRPYAWWVANGRLYVVADMASGGVAKLCCGIEGQLRPLAKAPNISGIALRIPDIDHAILEISVIVDGAAMVAPDVYRGRYAPASPPMRFPLRGLAAELDIYSPEMRSTRKITVYTPPGLDRKRSYPTIYLADGETALGFASIAEGLVDAGLAEPAIIVGVHSSAGSTADCGFNNCDNRNLEYVYEGGTRYKAYQTFLYETLIPFLESRYPVTVEPRGRIAAGFSSGAVWALSATRLRPDIFGAVIGMSPGAQFAADAAYGHAERRAFIGAGRFEPTFLASAQRRAERLVQSGAGLCFSQIKAGHASAMWDVLFSRAYHWLLATKLRDAKVPECDTLRHHPSGQAMTRVSPSL